MLTGLKKILMHKNFIVWSMEESQALEYSKCSWGLKLRLVKTRISLSIYLHIYLFVYDFNLYVMGKKNMLSLQCAFLVLGNLVESSKITNYLELF